MNDKVKEPWWEWSNRGKWMKLWRNRGESGQLRYVVTTNEWK